jgi:hypothetical protein
LIGKLYEARDLAIFPVRAKGDTIEVREGGKEGGREGGRGWHRPPGVIVGF